MKTVIFALLLCLASLEAVAQDKAAQPITREDIHGAIQNATSQMRTELRRLEKNVTTRTQKEREVLQKEQEELLEIQLKEQERLRADIERNAEASQKQLQEARKEIFKTQKVMIYGGAGALVILGIVVILWGLTSRNKTVVVRESHTHSFEESPLIDPEIPDLKKVAGITNKDMVPFIMTLREGERPLCVAQLIKGQQPLIISVDGLETKIGWADRKKKVAAELSSR